MERTTMDEGPEVGYQGETGAFSEEAVQLIFARAPAVPLPTIAAVFDGVRQETLDYGVVPLENSQTGSIIETYDLLAGSEVSIVGEAVVRVDHALVAAVGTRLEDVRRVFSHPQALLQCQEFLAALGVEVVPVYDTAGDAKRVAERGLNLSKLESRPLGHAPWEYRFYLDVDGGAGDLVLREALEEMGRETTSLKLLWSYARWPSG